MITYHSPLGLVYFFVLQFILQDYPSLLNIRIGRWFPSHLDVRMNPR